MESNKNTSILNDIQILENNKISYFQDADTSNIITAMSNGNDFAIRDVNDKMHPKSLVVENQPEALYNPYDDDYEDPF